MTRYIVQRMLSLIPTILGVTLAVFLLLRLIPGDPAVAMLGEHAAQENVERIREQLGLTRPLFFDREALEQGDVGAFFDSQYIRYLGRLARLDFGNSIHRRVPIAEELKTRFPATMELAMLSMVVAIIVGIPIGIASAARRASVIDSVTMVGALIGVSMPIFWLGLMEIMLFAVILGWFPSAGRLGHATEVSRITNLIVVDSLLTGNFTALVDALRHLVMPTIALSTIPMAIIARMTRSSMLEVLRQDYIRTAHAKGLRELVVLSRHALKNAFLPVITIIGIQMSSLMAGAVLTETIFSWPGIGKWVYDAILGRDYPIVQSGTLLITIVIVLVNLVVDLSYAFLDPRIHYE